MATFNSDCPRALLIVIANVESPIQIQFEKWSYSILLLYKLQSTISVRLFLFVSEAFHEAKEGGGWDKEG